MSEDVVPGPGEDAYEALLADNARLDKALRYAERRLARLETMSARTDMVAERNRAMMLRANEQLALTARRAEAAVRAKSIFLATMSHEIRTPMNGILGMLDLVSHSALDSEQRQYIETAVDSAQGLRALLDDVLDFSKVEAGEMTPQPTDVQPRDLLDDLGAVHASSAYAKNVALWVVIHPDVPHTISLDGQHLRQIVGNLVSNAVKFTSVGEVVVEAAWDAATTRLVVTVADTGIGIEEARLPAIFEPFRQADESVTRRFGGTGLGLAIVRELTAVNRGDLEASSHPNEGSRFVVRLPAEIVERSVPKPTALVGRRVGFLCEPASLARALSPMLATLGCVPVPLPADVSAEAVAASGVTLLIAPPRLLARFRWPLRSAPMLTPIALIDPWHDEDAHASGRKARPARLLMPLRQRQVAIVLERASSGVTLEIPGRAGLTTGEYRAVGGRVLIVEDNRVNQLVARRFVERLGFACDVVDDGAQGVERATRGAYDVVLMDCHMPVMDGFTATRRIHAALPAGSRPIIIALTASAMAEDRQECLDAGMDDYLAKPLDPASLERLLARYCLRSAGAPSVAPTRRRVAS